MNSDGSGRTPRPPLSAVLCANALLTSACRDELRGPERARELLEGADQVEVVMVLACQQALIMRMICAGGRVNLDAWLAGTAASAVRRVAQESGNAEGSVSSG